jgi:hypothetical protein
MKPRHVVALSLLAGLALGATAGDRLHAAEDGYVRKVPLDALAVPVPVPLIPPGSSLDLRPGRAPDSGDQINGYTPLNRESTTPSIGLSIKPLDDRR